MWGKRGNGEKWRKWRGKKSLAVSISSLSPFPPSLTIFSQCGCQAAAGCDNLLVTNPKEIICPLSDFWLSNKEVGAPPPFLFSGKTFKQWSPWFVIGNINRKVLLLLKTYCILSYLTFVPVADQSRSRKLVPAFLPNNESIFCRTCLKCRN